jgi:hypothetical protein
MVTFPRDPQRDKATACAVERMTGIPAEHIRNISIEYDGTARLVVEVAPIWISDKQASELLSTLTGAKVTVNDG